MNTSADPRCPICGEHMVPRITFKQHPKGKKFYVCADYPDCSGRVDPEPASEQQTEPILGDELHADLFQTPRRIVVESTGHDRQLSFYQACSFPMQWVSMIHEHDIDRRTIRSACQWRLDHPVPDQLPVGSESILDVVSVAEAILTRGTASVCSPALDLLIGDSHTEIPDVDALRRAFQEVGMRPLAMPVPSRFDSLDEATFSAWLQGKLRDHSLSWVVLNQVHLASLAPDFDYEGNERGDFLLLHPSQRPILVEIDGIQHADQQQRDRRRDASLTAAGIRVVRVPVEEVRTSTGPNLSRFWDSVQVGAKEPATEPPLTMALRACKIAHQVQISMLEAVRGGWLTPGGEWSIGIVLPSQIQSVTLVEEASRQAVRDIAELIDRLGGLYELGWGSTRVEPIHDRRRFDEATIIVSLTGADLTEIPTVRDKPHFLIADFCFPSDIAAPLSAARPLRVAHPDKNYAEWFLQVIFRKESFREGQWEAIERALQGKDSIVLLPTGSGKTIAFQLAAILTPGRCVVVAPLVALIDDQVDNLGKVGIDRCIGITGQINSRIRRQEVEDSFAFGQYLFCYVAPERFQTQEFRQSLRSLTALTPISLIAIDEAHCVSEWGHDFRPAYLNLGQVTRDYCSSQGTAPPLMALSGTASKIVLKDVQRELRVTDFEAVITPTSFDRPELEFSILRCLSSEKADQLKGYLNALPTKYGVFPDRFFHAAGDRTYSGLVFCPHVNGQYGVADQARYLSKMLGTKVEYYSGAAPKNTTTAGNWNAVKRDVMKRFKRNQTSLLACTKAFGMGIDKPNIRYTLHVGLPNSIEAFYQEAGRAGRDRSRAICAVVLSNDHRNRNERLLRPATPLAELISTGQHTSWLDSDDVTRALWFHTNTFQGHEAELRETKAVIEAVNDVSTARFVTCLAGSMGRTRFERSLHRLVVIGVVSDYTIDFASNTFTIKISGASRATIIDTYRQYAASYQPRLGDEEAAKAQRLSCTSYSEFVFGVAKLLTLFVYEHIEQARRRSLNEMLQALDQAQTSEDLRRRILDYLEHTEFDEKLEAVRTSTVGGLDALVPLIDDLVSPNDAAALRGSVARLLGSYPDVPGLLLLRSLTEAMSRDRDMDVVIQNLDAAISFSDQTYRIPPARVGLACGFVIAKIADSGDISREMLEACRVARADNREFMRGLLVSLPDDMAELPKSLLVRRLLDRSRRMLKMAG